MTAAERFTAAMREFDELLRSIDATSGATLPMDRLHILIHASEAVRLQAAFARGDSTESGCLANLAEDLVRDARRSMTTVVDSPMEAAPQRSHHSEMYSRERGEARFIAPIVTGGLIAISIFSSARMVSAAIRAVGSQHDRTASRQVDED